MSRAGRCEKQELKKGMQSVFKEKSAEGAGGSLKGPSGRMRAAPATPADTNKQRTEEAKQVVLKRKSSCWQTFTFVLRGGDHPQLLCTPPPPPPAGGARPAHFH